MQSPTDLEQKLLRINYVKENQERRKRKRYEQKKYTEAKRLQVDMSILKNSRSTSRPILYAIILTGVSAVIWQYLKYSHCCAESGLNSVKDLLTEKLHGQNTAIEAITESINGNSCNKLIFFFGPSGVGKTYASNIILEAVQNHYNILKFVLPTIVSFSKYNILIQLQLCDFLLIIVDDVTLNSGHTSAVIKDMVISNTRQINMYIILIFNTDIVTDDFIKIDDVNFKEKLELVYRDVPASKYFIKFNHLNEQHLRQCIDDITLSYKYDVPQQTLERLLSQLNVTFDGCKGVSSKIKYELGTNGEML